MLHLALSCLQGWRADEAAAALLALAPGRVGLQLTPGCAPHPVGGVDGVPAGGIRLHHGYTERALRAKVWEGGRLLWRGDSLHPPLEKQVPADWAPPADVVLETMYPGYAALADGEQILRAMDEGRWLAVDVAHLAIQLHHGVLGPAALRRVLDYERVAEVHVSTSRERRDTHEQLTPGSWGVDWAKSRLAAGTPVILECYMHRLTHEERLQQVALFVDLEG